MHLDSLSKCTSSAQPLLKVWRRARGLFRSKNGSLMAHRSSQHDPFKKAQHAVDTCTNTLSKRPITIQRIPDLARLIAQSSGQSYEPPASLSDGRRENEDVTDQGRASSSHGRVSSKPLSRDRRRKQRSRQKKRTSVSVVWESGPVSLTP